MRTQIKKEGAEKREIIENVIPLTRVFRESRVSRLFVYYLFYVCARQKGCASIGKYSFILALDQNGYCEREVCKIRKRTYVYAKPL